MFEAMVYILRTAVPWRDLPAVYGPWNSVYTRWRRWCQRGLWAKVLAVLARQAKGKLRFLDTSHVKVHQDASNPAEGQQNQALGRTKGGLHTKISAWVDGLGRAVSLSLAAGQHADVSVAQSVALQPAQARRLALRPLPKTTPGGELVPTLETLPQNRNPV